MTGADTIKTFFIFVFLTVIHFHPRLIFVDKTRSPPLEWTPARGLGHSLHRSKILVSVAVASGYNRGSLFTTVESFIVQDPVLTYSF